MIARAVALLCALALACGALLACGDETVESLPSPGFCPYDDSKDPCGARELKPRWSELESPAVWAEHATGTGGSSP